MWEHHCRVDNEFVGALSMFIKWLLCSFYDKTQNRKYMSLITAASTEYRHINTPTTPKVATNKFKTTVHSCFIVWLNVKPE